MPNQVSLLDELRVQYEAARQSPHDHEDNVDRLERVSLAFQSSAIDVAVLEDLVRLVLGRSAAFLRRAPLVGIHGQTG